MPDATVGVAYSRTLTAVGGRPEFAWLIESGSLPPGLSLAQTGSISGTPSTAGTFNFVVKVTEVGASDRIDVVADAAGLHAVIYPGVQP